MWEQKKTVKEVEEVLTQTAINDFKDFLDNIIAYGKVTVNGTVTKLPIHKRERLSDGRVAVYMEIHALFVAGTLSAEKN